MRPGAESQTPGQSVHARAGSHGTLRELDSLVPLLVAGGPADEVGAATPRIVDAAAVAAAYLEIPFVTRPGESHG